MCARVYPTYDLARAFIWSNGKLSGKRLKTVGKAQVYPTPNLPILSS